MEGLESVLPSDNTVRFCEPAKNTKTNFENYVFERLSKINFFGILCNNIPYGTATVKVPIYFNMG
jgi:hypothetical protein